MNQPTRDNQDPASPTTAAPARRGRVNRRTLIVGGAAAAGIATGAYAGSRGPTITFPEATYGAGGPRILVAYDSQYGSTAEIAAGVAQQLSSDAQVDLRPLASVGDLAPYSAMVLGAPVQTDVMKESATTWLSERAAELDRLPHAWFMPSASFGIDPDRERQLREKQGVMEDAAALTGTNPFALLPTGGLVDFSRMSFLASIVYQIASRTTVQGDFREPKVVAQWTDQITAGLLG
ncbi:MAG: flavodoxin domain-containing protein [Propioniciclava sp.]